MKNSNVEHARRKLLFQAEGGSSQIGSELGGGHIGQTQITKQKLGASFEREERQVIYHYAAATPATQQVYK